MIIDVISLPPLLVQEKVDFTAGFFSSRPYPTEEDEYVSLGRCFLSGLSHLSRYKIIEQFGDTFVEHVFLTDDDVDERSLLFSTCSDVRVGVMWYPITSRVHNFSSRIPRHNSFRYTKGIKNILSKLEMSGRHERMLSIHQMVLNSIHESAVLMNNYSLVNILHGYATHFDKELKCLFVSDDEESDSLLGQLESLINEAHHLSFFAQSFDDQIKGIQALVKVPRLPTNYGISPILAANGCINSDLLRTIRSTAFNAKTIDATVNIRRAFNLDNNTELQVHEDARWLLHPLENIPYTDVVLVYDQGTIQVQDAHSPFGRVMPIKQELLSDLASKLRYFVGLLNLGLCPLNFKATLTKTFSDDVYVEFENTVSGRRHKFYFDLTMAALSSRGLIDSSCTAALTKFACRRI